MIDNRKLSTGEQAMEIANRLTSSSNVVMIGRISGPLSQEIVEQALALVQTRHSRLNSRIVGDVDNLRFETGAKKIPLRVVNRQHPEQWQETVREELNAKMESSEVLMRAALVQEQELSENSTSHLMITTHHAISDGLSSIQLYSEILTYCAKISSGEPVVSVPSLPSLPPTDELLPPLVKGCKGKINNLLYLLRLIFKSTWYKPKGLSFEKTVPIELRRTGNVYRQLDAETTKQLTQRCRQEKTTVPSALCAALMLVAASKIKTGEKQSVSCWFPVDLRGRLKPAIGQENLGFVVSPVLLVNTLGTNTSLWDLAREVRQQLKVCIKRGDMFSQALMVKMGFDSMLKNPDIAPGTVSVSDVGRIKVSRVYGPFKVSEFSGTIAQATFGGMLCANVGTFDGKMLFHFPFSEPAISYETMETLADSFLSCLVDASS